MKRSRSVPKNSLVNRYSFGISKYCVRGIPAIIYSTSTSSSLFTLCYIVSSSAHLLLLLLLVIHRRWWALVRRNSHHRFSHLFLCHPLPFPSSKTLWSTTDRSMSISTLLLLLLLSRSLCIRIVLYLYVHDRWGSILSRSYFSYALLLPNFLQPIKFPFSFFFTYTTI